MERRSTLGLAVLLSLGTALGGQRLVCPLSEKQTEDAIKAFAKLAPIFTEPRCINCHGAVNPFGKGLNHPAETGFQVVKTGEMVNEPATFAPCQQCHGAFPNWRTAPPDLAFTGKNTTALCKMMKQQFASAGSFMDHMIRDRSNIPFTDVAFAGTMGLNEEGLQRATVKVPDPPTSMGKFQMVQYAQGWVDAMGGEFQGDDRCGCEPVRQALRVTYKAEIRLVGTTNATMGPVDIPIHFQDNTLGVFEHSFDGEGTLPFAANSSPPGCEAKSQGQMVLKLSGTADGVINQREMHIRATDLRLTSGTTSVKCNPLAETNPIKPGNKPTVEFTLKGDVGEEQEKKVPLPPPAVTSLRVKIIDLKPDTANPK